MKEESEEKITDEELSAEADDQVNRLLVFGVILAMTLLVPLLVVMWVAM